jgi:hypothetical protein
MGTRIQSLMLAVCIAGCSAEGMSQKPAQRCPIAIENLALGYNHAEGQSKPQLQLQFGNRENKRIATATFQLWLLGEGGYPHPYSEDLVYRDGLDPHKRRNFTWDLNPEAVDIHRTGESLILQAVEFDDGTTWKDDGSLSCELTVDYHPR